MAKGLGFPSNGETPPQPQGDAGRRGIRESADFVAKLSHELRTPLTAILGYAEMLRMHAKPHLPPSQYHQIEIIERSGHAMLRLISAVLDWSRLEAGRVHSEPRRFDVQQLFHGFAETMLPSARGKGLGFVISFKVTEPEFVTDPDLLRQIFANLVSNAIKYTDDGSITVTVETRAGELCLTVDDTGPGIPHDQQTLIFEEFHRLRGERKEGTGLGLAITRGLVQVLGGDIRVDSHLGRGTSFTVTLPMLEAQDEPTRDATLNLPFPDKKAGARILVVDDNRDNRELLSRFLEEEGYAVTLCENAGDCLLHVERERPDIVLMDMMMPEVDGFEATRRLRERYDREALPILAVTALAAERDRDKALQAGCNDCLAKPLDFSSLAHAIRRCLADQPALQK